jgi:hypothetical protein
MIFAGRVEERDRERARSSAASPAGEKQGAPLRDKPNTDLTGAIAGFESTVQGMVFTVN